MKKGEMMLSNCHKCGRVMLKGQTDICMDCFSVMSEQLQRCLQFLSQQDEATIEQVSEATDVSIKQIQEFIRHQHISPRMYRNLFYTCRVCREDTKLGHICDRCLKSLTR